MSAVMPTKLEPYDTHNQRKQLLKSRIACLKLPDPAYKAVNPAIVFNLSLEPAYLFNLCTFADKGGDDQIVGGRASFKLQEQVLYLENDGERYEICKQQSNSENSQIKYRFSRVLNPLFKDNTYMFNQRRPLEGPSVQIVASDLDWSDFQWGEKSLFVRISKDGGEEQFKVQQLKNYKYYPAAQ